MSYHNLKGLARKVGQVMAENQAARNDDHALAWQVWTRFEGLRETCGGKELMMKLYHDELSPFESISRARRKLQEEGLYPSDPQTTEKRSLAERSVRGQMRMW